MKYIILILMILLSSLASALDANDEDWLWISDMTTSSGTTILDIKNNAKPSVNFQVFTDDGLSSTCEIGDCMTFDGDDFMINNTIDIPLLGSIGNMEFILYIEDATVLGVYDRIIEARINDGEYQGFGLWARDDADGPLEFFGTTESVSVAVDSFAAGPSTTWLFMGFNSSHIYMASNGTMNVAAIGSGAKMLVPHCLTVGDGNIDCLFSSLPNEWFFGKIGWFGAINRSLTETERADMVTNGGFIAADSDPPGFFNLTNDASSAKIDDVIVWNVTFTDDTLLGSYIFENNITGVWGNDTEVSISGVHTKAGAELTVNVSNDANICGRFYVFDDVGNENVTDNSCFDSLEVLRINTIFTNKSQDIIDISLIKEGETFNINANFTKAGEALIGGSCNFTASNITGHFANVGDNFSLTSLTTLDLSISDTPTNLISDNIFFRICRENLKSSVEFFVNDSLNFTIDQNVIPLCNIGFHEENRMSSEFEGLKVFDISVRCSGCTGGREMRIISVDDERLQFERSFSLHVEPMTFNATLGMYAYREHLYTYTKQLNDVYINITCNSTINSTLFSTGDVSPIINILSIDDTLFTSGMQVESNESTRITIDVSGDIITSIRLNITYNNGTLIKSTGNETITLNNTELNINGIYNISVVAIDDEGNVSTLTDFFQLNDTTIPEILWNYPVTDNTSTGVNGTSKNLSILLSDLNLFAHETLIYSPGGVLFYNFSTTGVSGSSTSINDTITFNETGEWSVELMTSDDHTDMLIKDYDFEIYEKEFDKKSIIFNFEEIIDNKQIKSNVTIEYIGKYVTDYLVLDKLNDRYTFEYGMDLDVDINNKEVRHRFRVTCKDNYFIYNSDYIGHFVCYDAKKWVDFESPDVIDFFVEECGEGCYEIELITKPSAVLEFSSIGGLNIVEEHKMITVSAPVEPAGVYNINLLPGNFFNNDIIDTSTIPGVLLLFFLFACLVVLVIFGEHSEIPILMIFTGIYGLFFSLLIYVSISAILGVVFVVLSLMYIIRSMLFMK